MTGLHYLMHKNKKVATCYFDKNGFLKQIYEIHDENHMPVMTKNNPLQGLQQWLALRFANKRRPDIARLKAFYGDKLSPNTMASLLDAYWFQNTEKKQTWEEINFFDNFDARTDSVENSLFSHGSVSRSSFNPDSPNLTIPGLGERYWLRQGSSFFLLYKNAQKEMQEYKKARANNLSILPREYILYNDLLMTKVKSETSAKIERIPLEEYYIASDKVKNHSKVQNLISCCEQFQLPDYRNFFSLIADFDDLIGIEERELSDIGVLRDNETLEIIGFHSL